MKCSLCNTESTKGVNGPTNLFACMKCIESISDLDGVEINGTCSWCGKKIGNKQGIFKKRLILAVAVNPNSEVILCNECGKLCKDIVADDGVS